MEKSFNIPLPYIEDKQESLENRAKQIRPSCELQIAKGEAKSKEFIKETTKVGIANIEKSPHSLKVSFEEFVAKWGNALASTLDIRDVSFLRSRLENLAWYLGVQGNHDEIEWLALVLTLQAGERSSTFLDAFEKMKSWARVMAFFETNRVDHISCVIHESERGLLKRIGDIFRKVTNPYSE